jgi:hypothetical protein
MRLRSIRHTAGQGLAAALVAAALIVAPSPASAGEVGLQQLQEASGISVGPQTLAYDAPGTPLLDHFFFRDVNDDQHLRILSAMPRLSAGTGLLDVAFSDNTSNEQFEYRIAHQRVTSPALTVNTFTDTCRGQCTRTLTPPSSNVEFVISGFTFVFTSGDHHIDAIGIRYSNGQLTHWFNDQNDDDQYNVQIRYAWVPRSALGTLGTLTPTVPVHGVGQVTRTIPAGDKVIRGFAVDNVGSGSSEDNHIKRLGFLTGSTSVTIYYGDNDPSDSADWIYRLDYAVLN